MQTQTKSTTGKHTLLSMLYFNSPLPQIFFGSKRLIQHHCNHPATNLKQIDFLL